MFLFKNPARTLAILSFALTSFAAQAQSIPGTQGPSQDLPTQGGDEINVQAPDLSSGVDVTKLPQTAQASKKVDGRHGCTYAAYQIDKIPLSQYNDDTVSYEIRVTNLGDCNLKNVSLADYFPIGTTLDSAWPNPTSVREGKAFWNIEWLPVGTAKRVKIRFNVNNSSYSRWVTNNACAYAPLVGQRICAWASLWFEGGWAQ